MSFEDFFSKGVLESYANIDITFAYVVISMIVCIVLMLLVCLVYYLKIRKYFFSREFAVSLIALAVITTAIILTIQSSVVISLGMVGALSIVRFRTAIKNPLDLIFLFWAIANGIICGSGLYYVAIALTLTVGVVVLLSDDFGFKNNNRILSLEGKYPYDKQLLENIIKRHVRFWGIRTENIRNGRVNIIMELRYVKNNEMLLQELYDANMFESISMLKQDGEID